jgi:hypothetical protein
MIFGILTCTSFHSRPPFPSTSITEVPLLTYSSFYNSHGPRYTGIRENGLGCFGEIEGPRSCHRCSSRRRNIHKGNIGSLVLQRLISIQCYGLARLSGEKITPDTLFDCASNSKSLTAAAVALLVHDDNGLGLTWTTPVSEVLPDDFVLADPYSTKNITVEDILSHRSGMPGYVLRPLPYSAIADWTS